MSAPSAPGVDSERDLVISQLDDEVYRLTTLLNASALVAGSLEPDVVLQELVQQAGRVLGADAASLMLVDESANELVFCVAFGEKGQDLHGRRFSRDAGIAGAVVTTGKPVLIRDAQQDPRHFKQFDKEFGFQTGSVMAVPVQVRGQVLGVLEVMNPDTAAVFTDDDLTLLIAFATQTGLALANAQQHSDVQHQLAYVVECMQDGLILLDSQGDVTLVNPAARTLLALPGTGAVTQADLAGATGDPAALRPVEQATTSDLGVEREGGPPCVMHVNAAPLRGPAGGQMGTVMVLHDMSRRRELDRLKNEMITTVTHELRTPVASIQGSVQLLAQGAVDSASEEGRKFLDIIVRNADRLAKLVTHVVDLAALGSGRLEVSPGVCPLGALLAASADAARPMVTEAGLTLVVEIPDDVPDVWADTHRVQQVLEHLLDNARKFTPTGGTIRISATATAEAVTLCVEDTGPGIAPAEQERAFETFEQLASTQRDKAAGTGLGLPIARGIVEASGGRIWFEPPTGDHGTAIAFTLPIKPPSE